MPPQKADKPKKVGVAGLFEETFHDFGTVARAAKTEHVFKFKNDTNQTIELSSVRGASNCAKCTVLKKVVKPGETGGVRCQFNTRSFLGARRGTLVATFSKPKPETVTLDFQIYVRRDIVVDPPFIEFKPSKANKGHAATVKIEYAGSNDWKIQKASSSNPDIEVEFKQTHRGDGLVGYELTAKLRPMIPPEKIDNCRIKVLTNDNRLNVFPILVSGRTAKPAAPKNDKAKK